VEPRNSEPALAGIYLRLVLTTAAWGATFIAGRYLAQTMPHFTAASLRFLFALAGLLAFRVARGERYSAPLSHTHRVAIFALGATGIFAYNAGFFASLSLIPASRVSLMVAFSPILTLVAVQCIERAAWSVRLTSGVVLSFAGVLMVVSRGHLASLAEGAIGAGELYFLGAVLAWVSYTLIIRYFLQGVPALVTTTGAVAWGVFLLLIPAAFEWLRQAPPWPTPAQWGALAFLGLVGTSLAFVWYNRAVSVLGAARTTQFTNLVPVFGVGLSIALLGERPSVPAAMGGLMVIAGVMLAKHRR
jgi:drug/metabolite transporter (DMT)-like permease